MNETAYFSPDTEKAAIGAAMMGKEAARTVADLPNDIFAGNENIAIHNAIRTLVAEGKDEIDALMIMEAGKKNGSDISDLYLVDCADKCPSVRNLKHYVAILTGCAMRRRMRDLSKELIEKTADTTEDPDEVREWCARQLKDIRSADGVKLIDMATAARETFKALNEAQKGTARGISTGISSLDAILGGFKPGEMIVVGARPSVGKSILALTFCLAAAKTGKRVLLISMEMSETEITERVLANMANVPMSEMTNGGMTPEHMVSVGAELGRVGRLPMWYCLEASTVEQVRRAAYRLYEDGGLDMLVVDYLQLMEAGYSKAQSRQEQISEISRGLRKLSMELNVPVIVLSQLNRLSEGYSKDGGRVTREPTMSQARESGAIEQDANVFMLLHNPRRDEMKTPAEQMVWDNLTDKGLTPIRLIVDKNRQGERGRILLAFDGSHMRFMPITRD